MRGLSRMQLFKQLVSNTMTQAHLKFFPFSPFPDEMILDQLESYMVSLIVFASCSQACFMFLISERLFF